jgi:hypothetical protein
MSSSHKIAILIIQNIDLIADLPAINPNVLLENKMVNRYTIFMRIA